MTLSDDGQIAGANPAMCDMLGLENAEQARTHVAEPDGHASFGIVMVRDDTARKAAQDASPRRRRPARRARPAAARHTTSAGRCPPRG